MKTHYHCTVGAYDKFDEDKNSYVGKMVEIELMGYLSEEDAIARAKKLVNAPNYVMRRIWPCFRCKLDNKKDEE